MKSQQLSTGTHAQRRFWPSAETCATAILGLMVSLPFVLPVHTLPIPSFHSEWLAMVLGGLGLMTIALQKNRREVWVPSIAGAPLALITVAVVQWALGMFAYGATAFTLIMMLLWAALISAAGQTLVRAVGEHRLTSRLAWFLCAGGLLNALFGLLQYLGLWQAFGGLISTPLDLSKFGIYGNLAQENHFATHLSLALVSASYLCFSRQLKTQWFFLAGLPCLLALALSGSRSSFLYLVWIVVLSLGLMRRGPEKPNYKRMASWAVAAVLTLALLVWMAVLFSPSSPQLQRLLTFSSAFGPRMTLWQHAITMFLQHPILGVGFDAFAYHLVGQLHPSTDPVVWGVDQYAHNLILQLLAVAGLCGLLAVAVPLLALLRRMLAAPYSVERLWGWGVIGLLIIHSMLEQPLFYSYFLGLIALVAGLSDTKAWAFSLRVKTRTVVIAICSVALLLLFKTANDYDNIEGHFYSGRYGRANKDHQTVAEQNVIQALKQFSIFSPLAELIAPEHVLPASASASEKVAFNERVMRYAPVAEIEFRHAALLAEDQRMAEATRQFARAAFAYPHDAEHYLTRFKALAAADSATYGPLSEFATEWMRTRSHPDHQR
jgi:O-antigen ligase